MKEKFIDMPYGLHLKWPRLIRSKFKFKINSKSNFTKTSGHNNDDNKYNDADGNDNDITSPRSNYPSTD